MALQSPLEIREDAHQEDRRSVCYSGQVRPEDIAQLAQQGYVVIVCARPDNEEPGQPAFAAIAREAEKHGMKAIHIPVTGAPSAAQVDRLEEAMDTIDGPVLGYCRSGARSAALYSSIGQ